MSLLSRQQAIQELERARQSTVITFVLNDRRVGAGVTFRGFQGQLTNDAYPFIWEHLQALKPIGNLDLVFHSSGAGNVDALLSIVALCRDVAEHFSVLVPMRATGMATLLCLGADEILMCEPAVLSGVFVQSTSPLNPREQNRPQPLPVALDDLLSYFDLINEVYGSQEVDVAETMKPFASLLHPLAIDSALRIRRIFSSVARKLLSLSCADDEAIDRIVQTLVEERVSPLHRFGRSEARRLLGNDRVKVPEVNIEMALWNVYREYADFFEWDRAFNVKDWMRDDREKELVAFAAAIESRDKSHIYRTKTVFRLLPEIQTSSAPPQMRVEPAVPQKYPTSLATIVNVEPISDGWFQNAVD